VCGLPRRGAGPKTGFGQEVPSFVSIAKRPGFSTAKLAFFLLDPHPKMPDMSLTRAEAEDIAAYIARLGR
jgi:hypothetical protein